MRTATVWRGTAAIGLWTILAAFTAADEPAKDDPTRATLVVHLPVDAQLFVQGKVTNTPGETRVFWSPPLEAGKRYEYSFKATWKEDGKEVSRQERTAVKAGDKVEVDLRGPRELTVKPPPEPVKPDPVVKKPDPEPVKKPDPEPVKKPDPVVKKPDPEPTKPDPVVKKPDPEPVKKPDPEPTKPDPVVKKPDPEVKKPDPEPAKKPDPEPVKPDPVVKKPDPEPVKKPDPEPAKKPDPEPTKPDPVVKKPDPEVKKPDPEPVKKPDPEPVKKPDPVVKKPDPEPTKPESATLTLEMPGTLNLQVGGFTKILPVTVHRNGVKGPITVKFENLPTGVAITDATIPEDADRADVEAKVGADVEITEADFKVCAVADKAKAEFVLKIKVAKR